METSAVSRMPTPMPAFAWDNFSGAYKPADVPSLYLSSICIIGNALCVFVLHSNFYLNYLSKIRFPTICMATPLDLSL
jgi:hypothetical protein